jgi:hypothetical protein
MAGLEYSKVTFVNLTVCSTFEDGLGCGAAILAGGVVSVFSVVSSSFLSF